MKTYLAVLIISGLGAFFLTPLARWLAFKLGAVDIPNERKIHKQPMPRLGGVAVFCGFCLPWAAFYFLDNQVADTFQNYEKLFLALMLGATAMLLLGIYDDIRGADAIKKFGVQILTALGLYAGGYQIETMSNPFGPAFELGWLGLPVTVLWIVGITNAINLLDGIDGLASGVTGCIAISLAIINILSGNIIVALLTLCLAGACFGFLPHNFSPSKIFLGDSGSLFLGIVLSCIGILSLFKAATASFVVVPLVLFGLPLFDTTSVMIGRALRGTSIFQADKSHVHHRLLQHGWNQRQAAYFLYGVTIMLGAVAVLLSLSHSRAITISAGTVVLVSAVFIGWKWRHRAPEKPKG